MSPTQTAPRPSAKKRRVRGIDFDVDDVKLETRGFVEQIGETLTSADIARTIEGASTISMNFYDPNRRIQKHAMVQRRIDLELDDLWFRLVGIRKDSDSVGLTFEDREVALLRKLHGPKKAFRDRVTRAEFIRSLVKEAKPRIPMYIPELHIEQPIKGKQEGEIQFDTQRGDKRGGSGGLDSNAQITVKHVRATSTQIHNIEQVLDTGVSMGADKRVLVSSIMTITQESDAINLTGGDLDSVGLFQQRPSAGWPASRDIPKDSAAYFKKAIAYDKAHPSASLGAICQAVQVSAYPSAYEQWQSEAENTVSEYLGGHSLGSLSGSATVTSFKRYAFEVKKHENYWDAIQRLAQEVKWRAFVSAGIFYYVSEEEMFKQKVRYRIDESSPGVDYINYNYDMGRKVTEVTVEGRAKDWEAPPGTVVVIKDEFAIPEVSGRYIVSQIRSSLTDASASITLKKPMKAMAEPAPEKVTSTTQFGDQGGLAGSDQAGTVTFDGVKICSWIEPIVKKARASGLWNGKVVSGFRTDEESRQLCIQKCGQPTCPGTCAGTSSNHNGCTGGKGAVDVTDAAGFDKAMREQGYPLKNALPKDLGHYSKDGH